MAFEGVVLAYLAFFAVAAPFVNATRPRRAFVVLIAIALGLAIFVATRALTLEVRLWLALAYLPMGYWLPAPLVSSHSGSAFEAWLKRSDDMVRRFGISLPRSVAYGVELGYLACYPLVPVAFALVWSRGTRLDVARFWMAVLTAGYACYVTLPWLVSRPPRLIDEAVVPDGVARVNRLVLDRLSHDLVTFPSAHVAVAVAAAAVATRVWLPGGAVLAVVAAGVAIGAVAGRYHFMLDVVLGAIVGIIAGQH